MFVNVHVLNYIVFEDDVSEPKTFESPEDAGIYLSSLVEQGKSFDLVLKKTRGLCSVFDGVAQQMVILGADNQQVDQLQSKDQFLGMLQGLLQHRACFHFDASKLTIEPRKFRSAYRAFYQSYGLETQYLEDMLYGGIRITSDEPGLAFVPA